MKVSCFLSLALSSAFAPFANAVLEQSPPNSTWIRLYEKDNCDVTYHQTGIKDFKRVVCGPQLLPGAPGSCAAGKFRSYRLELNPVNPSLPKLDKLFVKHNSPDCDFGPDMSDATVFQTHPFVNPEWLEPGCHSFDAAKNLAIGPDSITSFMCTWASFTEQPNAQGGMPPIQQDPREMGDPLEPQEEGEFDEEDMPGQMGMGDPGERQPGMPPPGLKQTDEDLQDFDLGGGGVKQPGKQPLGLHQPDDSDNLDDLDEPDMPPTDFRKPMMQRPPMSPPSMPFPPPPMRQQPMPMPMSQKPMPMPMPPRPMPMQRPQ